MFWGYQSFHIFYIDRRDLILVRAKSDLYRTGTGTPLLGGGGGRWSSRDTIWRNSRKISHTSMLGRPSRRDVQLRILHCPSRPVLHAHFNWEYPIGPTIPSCMHSQVTVCKYWMWHLDKPFQPLVPSCCMSSWLQENARSAGMCHALPNAWKPV